MNRPHWQVMGRRTYAALAALPEEVRDQGWHDMAFLTGTPNVPALHAATAG